jgi:hypothetical protein
MSDFLATALGLAFTLIVCLFAVHALLGPWLRLRRAPAAAGHADEEHAAQATQRRNSRPIHTS